MNNNLLDQLPSNIFGGNKSSFMSWINTLVPIFSDFGNIFNQISDPIYKNIEIIISSVNPSQNMSITPLTIDFSNQLNENYTLLKFIHELQTEKMTELWDNDVDEEWDYA